MLPMWDNIVCVVDIDEVHVNTFFYIQTIWISSCIALKICVAFDSMKCETFVVPDN